MSGQPLRLGPFIGGLNTASDPTAIADAEVADLTNLELDIDGSLISRPPIQEIVNNTSWTERIIMLGEAVFSGDHYLIASNADGVFHFLDGVWTEITATFQASVAIQFADEVWLVPKPGETADGGRWNPVDGFRTVAALPQGQAAIIHKERMFLVPGIDATTNESRLKFSDAGDLTTWPATNFIDVGQGDGQNLVDITVFQDNLLLFKTRTTYVLAYDIRPADAILRQISLTIGADRQFVMVNYENQVYLFHEGWVYEIINYDFHRLNTKVPFVRDETSPSPYSDEKIHLSLVADRLIARFFNRIYVYGLRTRTWSEIRSESDVLHFFGPIVAIHPIDDDHRFYAGSCLIGDTAVMELFDDHVVGRKEQEKDPVDTTANDTFTRTVVDGWGTATSGEVWALSANDGGVDSAPTGQQVEDTFTRSVIGDWGTSDSGHTYVLTSNKVGATYDVDGAKGTVTLGADDLATRAAIQEGGVDIVATDYDNKVTVSSSAVATGEALVGRLLGRFIDPSNFYTCNIAFQTDGNVFIELDKVEAGVGSQLASPVNKGAYLANDEFTVRFQTIGNELKVKLWAAADPEPAAWDIEATDSTFPDPGGVGIRTDRLTGNTNTDPIISYDDLEVLSTEADFQVDGSVGTITGARAGAEIRQASLGISLTDVDVVWTTSTDTLGSVATDNFESTVRVRHDVAADTYYTCRVKFQPDDTIELNIRKTINSVRTTLVFENTGISYAVGERIRCRFRAQGVDLQAKIWKETEEEPPNWRIETTDSEISAAGDVSLAQKLWDGIADPITLSYDDLEVKDVSQVALFDIECSVKTKNFDMAVSHQFKRLWWWGADVSTDRDITGTAAPVIVAFNVTWGDLSSHAWETLNTWAQPLAESSAVVTVQPTGTGTARRFAKFLKSLRYRQINFQVELVTDGSTLDGPARLFTMTIITATKQRVPKGVN